MRKNKSYQFAQLAVLSLAVLVPSASRAQEKLEGGPASGGGAPTATTADDKTVGAEAIASSVAMRKGRELPLISKGSGADTPMTGGASCELYETTSFQAAMIDVQSPYHVPKSNSYPVPPPEKAVYSPPNTDWVIQSFERVITSAGGTWDAAVSAIPPNYTFLTSGNYSSVTSTMHSYVGSLNIPDVIKADINSKLDTLISNISSYSWGLSGSSGSIISTATVWGTGVINLNQGHSWYDSYIEGTLICSPTYLHDQNALVSRLKTWVNSVIKKIPLITPVPVPAHLNLPK